MIKMSTQAQLLGWKSNTVGDSGHIVVDVRISCRLCLLETSNEDSFDIYSTIWFMEHEESNREDTHENSIKTMLEHVTNLSMEENDGLPRRVCKQCLNIAWKFYLFRNQVAEADSTLRKHLGAHSNNIDSWEEHINNSKRDVEGATNSIVDQNGSTQWNVASPSENIEFAEELKEIVPQEETETFGSLNNDTPESDISEEFEENVPTKIDVGLAKMKKDKKTQRAGKVHVCLICNRTFSLAQTLSRHAKLHESLSKNKQCSYCGKCFNRTDDLRRHIRIHTGKGYYFLS